MHVSPEQRAPIGRLQSQENAAERLTRLIDEVLLSRDTGKISWLARAKACVTDGSFIETKEKAGNLKPMSNSPCAGRPCD